MMELVTTRSQIRSVAERWKQQYPTDQATMHFKSTDAIHARLLALDTETATAEDVSAVIGNDSWTRIRCDQCRKDVDAAVVCGEAPNYESNTANLCVPCLESALALAKGTP